MSCRSGCTAKAFDERTPRRIVGALVALAWLVAATSLSSPLRAQDSTDDDESLRPGILAGLGAKSEQCPSACDRATLGGFYGLMTVGRVAVGTHGDLTGTLWGRTCILGACTSRALSVLVAGVRFTPESLPPLTVRGGVGGYHYQRGDGARAYGPAARLAVWYHLPSPYVEGYALVVEWIDGLGGVLRAPATSLGGAPLGEAYRPRVIAVGIGIE